MFSAAAGFPGECRRRAASAPTGRPERCTECGEGEKEVGDRLLPVGELAGGHAFLGLGEDGELYVVANWLARFGRMPEAMENLVLGVMPVRMPEPEQAGTQENVLSRRHDARGRPLRTSRYSRTWRGVPGRGPGRLRPGG
ncbi:SUKH-3 domain-containing protein [Streptomyces sp. NPDC058872]|uniref:SUKH-3 domain-containing protein n=1 Tax=Streptomyces sp. NPDC058872 TaxID=3346661 RepID=UPI0036BF65E1